MNQVNNEALRTLAKNWKLDGDLLVCRECERGLIASREGEPLAHRAGCKNVNNHPWNALRSAIK